MACPSRGGLIRQSVMVQWLSPEGRFSRSCSGGVRLTPTPPSRQASNPTAGRRRGAPQVCRQVRRGHQRPRRAGRRAPPHREVRNQSYWDRRCLAGRAGLEETAVSQLVEPARAPGSIELRPCLRATGTGSSYRWSGAPKAFLPMAVPQAPLLSEYWASNQVVFALSSAGAAAL